MTEANHRRYESDRIARTASLSEDSNVEPPMLPIDVTTCCNCDDPQIVDDDLIYLQYISMH